MTDVTPARLNAAVGFSGNHKMLVILEDVTKVKAKSKIQIVDFMMTQHALELYITFSVNSFPSISILQFVQLHKVRNVTKVAIINGSAMSVILGTHARYIVRGTGGPKSSMGLTLPEPSVEDTEDIAEDYNVRLTQDRMC